MGKLFYIIGKSSAGKDTIFKKLLDDRSLNLKPLVIYTTRPMREGEKSGEQYYFTDETGLRALQDEGRVIELRTYETVKGTWKYFTADTENTDLRRSDYIGVGVLTSFLALKKHYGADRVVPVYIELEDGERLKRAIAREQAQKVPQYAEMCRRYLADSVDFSEEKLTEAGITKRFVNLQLDGCVAEIGRFIADVKKLC